MDYDLNHCFSKETCVRNESNCVCTFHFVEARQLSKRFWSISCADWHAAGLPSTESIPNFCDLYRERSSRAGVLYSLFRSDQKSVLPISRGSCCRLFLAQNVEAHLRRWISQLHSFSWFTSFYTVAVIEENIRAMAIKCPCSYSTRTLLGYTVQKIAKVWTALVETSNLAPLANLVPLVILYYSQTKNILWYWENGSKDLLLVTRCTMYCMERSLSETRMTCTMQCKMDINRWTLRFGS